MNAASTPIAHPLKREHMPSGYAISLDRYMGREGVGEGFFDPEPRIPYDFGPSQPMSGFEETYKNIIDYIVRITYRIWEDRDVEYILDTYSENSRVYDDYGLQHGNRKIVGDTHHTTAAFSNIELVADEVIWAGDDEVGYHTSHRTIIRGTNDGDSQYGPATDKRIDVLVIANCVALGNEIFLEHVLYNNASMLQQLGFDLSRITEQMANTNPPAGWPRDEKTWQKLRYAARPETPVSISQPVDGFDVDAFVRSTFDGVWNRNDTAVLTSCYDEDFRFTGPTDRAFSGAVAYGDHIKDLKQCFPDLTFQMDEVYWMGNEQEGFLSSERWSATGRHLSGGRYGKPTGIEVQIWGITQHRIVDGKINREWMLFNELDLMMQIARARN